MSEKRDQDTVPESTAPVRATVENKAPKPAGLLPKNTQQLVILGIAVVMLLIMWLSGGTKRTRTVPAPLPVKVQPPNPATVEEFKQTIQQQQAATRQPISPENLERLRSLGLAGDVPPDGGVAPPTAASIPQPGGVAGGGAMGTEATAEHDPVKEDRKKRAYLSLFAPNVAFTSRRGREAEPLNGSTISNPMNLDDAEVREAQPGPVAPVNGQGSASMQKRPIAPDAFNASTGKTYVVFEGTILESLLINRLNGTFSGPVNCLVTTDVYSHDRQHLIIPAGTKVLGEAKKVDAFGQQRLAVFFHRLIMPDGFSVTLDQFKGLNQIGETSLRDKVNNHYLQIFGASLAIGILGGIAQAGTGNVYTNSTFDQARAGFGSSLANSAMQILDKFLNVLPTVTIREGNRVKVYLAGDLLLPDYSQHTMQPDI